MRALPIIINVCGQRRARRPGCRKQILLALSLAATLARAEEPAKIRFPETFHAKKFYKGNLHTHTDRTDGDAPPKQVLKWFKKNGYHFVSITDHDLLTKTSVQPFENFITLPGVEITSVAKERRPVHVNAICGTKTIKSVRKSLEVADTLQKSINLAKEDGAIAIVNHPNFGLERGFFIKPEDLLAMKNFDMLEVASGHPQVYDRGDPTHPSAEELWDQYLSKNGRIFGVAVDDSHNYQKFAADKENPGRGWVEVWTEALSRRTLCKAIREGHFYFVKFGAKLKSLKVEPVKITLEVEDWMPNRDYVDFIGKDGKMLEHVESNPASYTLKGDETYVRAHLVQKRLPTDKKQASNKKIAVKRNIAQELKHEAVHVEERAQPVIKEAWTQPYFVN